MQSPSLHQLIVPLHVGRPLPSVVALSAYFDESKNGGVYAVAGYLGTVPTWDRLFSPKWSQIISNAPKPISEFKAADCRHRTGEFRDWTKEECTGLTTQCVDLLVDETMPNLFGLGCAIDVDALIEIFKNAPRNNIESMAHLMCVSAVVYDVLRLTEMKLEAIGNDVVHVIFDEQRDFEYRVKQIFDVTLDQMPEPVRRRMRRPQHERSVDVFPLQAADLLAYETYKEMVNRSEKPPRPMSIALRRLVTERRMHAAHYWDDEHLRFIFKNIDRDSPSFDEIFSWLNGLTNSQTAVAGTTTRTYSTPA